MFIFFYFLFIIKQNDDDDNSAGASLHTNLDQHVDQSFRNGPSERHH